MKSLLCGLMLVAAADVPLDGNQILARAGAAQGLSSYAAPVHFDVHLHRPIGFRAGADAIVYYRAPAQAVLVITRISSIIRKLFKTSYSTDFAPQVWPSKYEVNAVSEGESNGASTFVLEAVPKADPAIDHVVFTVAQANDAPLAAAWFYKNGSTVRLSMVCQPTSTYMLPKSESIAVSMPQFSLDATGVYGTYALNTPVPDSVFQTH